MVMLAGYHHRLVARRRTEMMAAPIITKVTVFLVFLYFAECAAGSCISYGHACWGGHGKRSNNLKPEIKEVALNLNDLVVNKDWLLSRLINSKLGNLGENKIARFAKQDDYDEKNSASLKSVLDETHAQNWQQDFPDVNDDDNSFLQRADDKIKLYKLLKLNSAKTNYNENDN